MKFKNREEAAHLLVKALSRYKGQNPLVLAIPRGAIYMAKIIADKLGGEANVVLVHKLGAPYQPELAIGAIDESGEIYLNEHANNVSENYIQQESQKQLATLKNRRIQYSQGHKAPSSEGRVVIVVDDGIATGATMIAALKSLKNKNPKHLIAAIPVGPSVTLQYLKTLADEVVYLDAPFEFYAVGQFYDNFPQVSDDEVIQVLND